MKSMEELRDQFNREEFVWKQKMNHLKSKNDNALKEADSKEKFEEARPYIDESIMIIKRMGMLDTKHKKFLMRWSRRFRLNTIMSLRKSSGE